MPCTLEHCSVTNLADKKGDESTYVQRKLPGKLNLFTDENKDGILKANQGTITECPTRKLENAGLRDRIVSSSIIQTDIGQIEYILSNSRAKDTLCGSRFAPELVYNEPSWKESSCLEETSAVLDCVVLKEEVSVNFGYGFETDTVFCLQALKIFEPPCSSCECSSATVLISEVFNALQSTNIQQADLHTTNLVSAKTFKRPVSHKNGFSNNTMKENNLHSLNLNLSEIDTQEEYGTICDSVLSKKKPVEENQASDHIYFDLHQPSQPECLVDVNIEVNKPGTIEISSGSQKEENGISVENIETKKDELETKCLPEMKSTACNGNILQLERNIPSRKLVIEKCLTQVEQTGLDTCGSSDKMTGICPVTDEEIASREDPVFDTVNHTTEGTVKSPMAHTAESTSVAPPVTPDAENVSSSGDCSYSASICSPPARAPHEGEHGSRETVPSEEQGISTLLEASHTSTYDPKLDDDEYEDSTYKRMTVRALLKKYERLTDELKRTHRSIDMLFLRRHAQKLSKSDSKSKTHVSNRNSKECEWADSKSTESTTTISQPFEEQQNDQDRCTKKVHGAPYAHPVPNQCEFMPNESKSHVGMMQYPGISQSSNLQFAPRSSAPKQDGVIYSHNSGPALMEGCAMPPNFHQPYAPECMDYFNDDNPSVPRNPFEMTFVPSMAPNTMPANQYFRGRHRDGQSISRQSTGNSVKCFTSSSRSRSAHHSEHHGRHRTVSRRKSRSHRDKHSSYFQKQTHGQHHHNHHHRAKSHCAPHLNVKCFHQNALNSFATDITQCCMYPECPNHCGTHSISCANLPSSFGSAAPGGIYPQPIPLTTPFGPSLPPNTPNWSCLPWPMAHAPLHPEQPHYYWSHTFPPPPSSTNFGSMENQLFKGANCYSEAPQSGEIHVPNRPTFSVLPDAHSKEVRQPSPCTNESVPPESKSVNHYNISEYQPSHQTSLFKSCVTPSSASQLASYSGATMESTVPDSVQMPAAFTGRTIPRSPVQRIHNEQPSTDVLTMPPFVNEHRVTKNQTGFAPETPESLSKLLTTPSSLCEDHSGAKDKGLICDSSERNRMQLVEIPTKLANEERGTAETISAIQCPQTASGTRILDWARSVSDIWKQGKMQPTESLGKQTERILSQKQPQTAQAAIVSRANLLAEPATPEEWKNVELRYDYLQKQKMIVEGQISRLPKQSSVNKFNVKKEEEILVSNLTPINRELSALRLLMRKRCSQTRTMIKMKH